MPHCARLMPCCTSRGLLWGSTQLWRWQGTRCLWSAGSTVMSSSSSVWRKGSLCAAYASWSARTRTIKHLSSTKPVQTSRWILVLIDQWLKMQYARILFENIQTITKIINIIWRNISFDIMMSVYFMTEIYTEVSMWNTSLYRSKTPVLECEQHYPTDPQFVPLAAQLTELSSSQQLQLAAVSLVLCSLFF